MSDDIKVGDRVTWTSSGGKSVGRVKKKLTQPMDVKGHHVAASADNPEFLVESDSGGGQAAHKPASLKKASPAGPVKKGAKKATTAKSAPAKKTVAKKKSASKKSSAKR